MLLIFINSTEKTILCDNISHFFDEIYYLMKISALPGFTKSLLFSPITDFLFTLPTGPFGHIRQFFYLAPHLKLG
ncbi:hypothetical protein I1900192L5_19760 [Odoribacter splanchnicus]